MRFRPARLYTWIASLGLALQGTTTLTARLIPEVDSMFPFLLEQTKMIASHSLLHVASAVLGFAALSSHKDAWPVRYALLFGLFYAGLAYAGQATGHHLGIGLQPFDHAFHAVLGGAGVLAGVVEIAWVRLTAGRTA